MEVVKFPPRPLLRAVLSSMAKSLPVELDRLFEHDRFLEGRTALSRLADPSLLDRAIAEMSDLECGTIAEQMLARWARLAEPQLDPSAAIVGPTEIARDDRPARLLAAALGFDEWTATWEGATDASEREAIVLPPPGVDTIRIRLTIYGRNKAGRAIAVAHHTLNVR